MLTACEWMDVFVDQQGQVRQGVHKNSYWDLQVDQPGEYEFELRRWPREIDLAMTDNVQGGNVMPIAYARILISGVRHVDLKKPLVFEGEKKQVQSGDKAAIFNVHLNAGPITLHTWFDDAKNNTLSGAYYVYVKRK